MTKRPALKCVIVGDGGVGKTCMLISYCTNKFPTGYTPTVFDSYAARVVVGNEVYTLGLFDTAGQEAYDRLRILAYPETDVFLVCFSVTSRDSLINTRDVWVKELRRECGPHVKFILVGTQIDMRAQVSTGKCITRAEGEKMAKHIGACSYVECSALTHQRLKYVFDEAILAALDAIESKPQAQSCLSTFTSCFMPKVR